MVLSMSFPGPHRFPWREEGCLWNPGAMVLLWEQLGWAEVPWDGYFGGAGGAADALPSYCL